MKHTLTLLSALLLALQAVARAADELVLYPPVPGLAASEHYNAVEGSVPHIGIIFLFWQASAHGAKVTH